MSTTSTTGNPNHHLLTAKETAVLLATSVGTLANWRSAGVGPEYVKLGGGSAVRYRLQTLSDWLDAHTVRTLDAA